MKLSTRARYGLKALIDLGLHSVPIFSRQMRSRSVKSCVCWKAAWKQQPVPGLRMTEPAMAVMYVWQSSSGRESMTVLQALSIP